MIKKLKREWKTAATAVVGIFIEAWDLILGYQLDLVDPLIAPEHQWMVHMGIPMLMLLLRKWKDTKDAEIA